MSRPWWCTIVVALLALPAAGLLAGCGGGGHATACEATEDAVRVALDELMAADSAEDLAGAVSMYSADVVWLPPNGETINGREAIAERYRALFEQYDVSVAADVDLVAIQDGQFASIQGATVGELVPLETGGTIPIDDAFLMLMTCEPDGRWRVSHLAWSHRGQGGPGEDSDVGSAGTDEP